MVGFPRGDGKVSLLRGEVECHGRTREDSLVEVVDRECHADQSGGFDHPTARTNPTGGISPCKTENKTTPATQMSAMPPFSLVLTGNRVVNLQFCVIRSSFNFF